MYSSLFTRLEKYLDKWLSLSPFTQNYECLKDLILVEQLRECMTPDLRIFIDESGVTTPQEIVSYSDRFLAAHREKKTKTSDQNPSIAKVDKQPDPPSSSNNNINKQTRQPNNQAPRHPIPPNPPRQQKKWCSFHYSSTHDSSECHNRSRPYSSQPLMVITQATPVLDSLPSNHPPTVEKVLVNGLSSNCLYDSGCSFSAIVRKSLVKPRYISNKWVTIQGADLNSPPFTLPIARIKVKSRYVNGRIEAAVMNNPCFDLTLGDKYVFLGTPTNPGLATPGVTPVNPNATNPSVPETDHISAFPVITGAQAPQDGARETLNSLRRGYKESP
ncbi:centrosome-associated protein CEP250 [Biomphalaria pfeifferi]|uniref:Centrosome-associated protein CEP250 n=1 Tax=Biomphalaria pfeifferi TaxID=112525 RepID=A0AAD8CE75_BIOPF|nr:centrosome-associated protein CEP250 [Biomphalaria pfeifferi]